MALAKDLAQIGIISRHADFLGDTQGDVLSAAGATQATATALTKSINSVTAVNPGQGVRLPTIASAPFSCSAIRNDNAANNLLLYPATGEQINILGANNPLTIPPTTGVLVCKVSSTRWITV